MTKSNIYSCDCNMSAKQFYKILAAIIGYGVIVGGYVLFDTFFEKKILILDIIVSCLAFTQILQLFFYQLVNTERPAQKEVGMMGLHFFFLYIYFLGALTIIIIGIVYKLSFQIQLLLQLAILFLLISGRFITLYSGEKVERVYDKEQGLLQGKKKLSALIEELMDCVYTTQNLDSNIKKRMEIIADEIRFFSPSTTSGAYAFDLRIAKRIECIKTMLKNNDFDKDQISGEVVQLERELAKRKKY